MRRFSQRNPLVTLSDINITPLLDLAFVLLIIFAITTPLLDNGMDLKLPAGGKSPTEIDRRLVQQVEIGKDGKYMLNKKEMSLATLGELLVRAHRFNPDIIVSVRADRESRAKHFYPVIDLCVSNGITRLSLKTQPKATP